jgi:hypothetical protein
MNGKKLKEYKLTPGKISQVPRIFLLIFYWNDKKKGAKLHSRQPKGIWICQLKFLKGPDFFFPI